MAKKNWHTFEDFLRGRYNMSYGEYLALNDAQQKAVQADWYDYRRS